VESKCIIYKIVVRFFAIIHLKCILRIFCASIKPAFFCMKSSVFIMIIYFPCFFNTPVCARNVFCAYFFMHLHSHFSPQSQKNAIRSVSLLCSTQRMHFCSCMKNACCMHCIMFDALTCKGTEHLCPPLFCILEI